MKNAILLFTLLFSLQAVNAQTKKDTIDSKNFNETLFEKLLFQKVNEYRKDNGVKEVLFNSMIYKVAYDHATYLNLKDKIGHSQTIEGKKTVQDRLRYYTKVQNFTVGENIARTVVLKRTRNYLSNGTIKPSIAYTYEEAVEYMLNAWKQSSFHNTNMLSTRFELSAISAKFNPATKSITAVNVLAKIG